MLPDATDRASGLLTTRESGHDTATSGLPAAVASCLSCCRVARVAFTAGGSNISTTGRQFRCWCGYVTSAAKRDRLELLSCSCACRKPRSDVADSCSLVCILCSRCWRVALVHSHRLSNGGGKGIVAWVLLPDNDSKTRRVGAVALLTARRRGLDAATAGRPVALPSRDRRGRVAGHGALRRCLHRLRKRETARAGVGT